MSFIFSNKTSHQEIVSGPLCTGETGNLMEDMLSRSKSWRV